MSTIIAQATPAGESAISVIRISGSLSVQLAKDACGYNCEEPRRAKVANYQSITGDIIDQVVITYFEKGKSYTGDDSLEISCHGNQLISQLISEDLLQRGCRTAAPGEFTKLAFLNGKIDLSQAESVAQIISAKNHFSLAAAQRNLKGDLSEKLIKIQNDILKLQASIEAYIDFPEDDLDTQDYSIQDEISKSIQKELETLLAQASKSQLLKRNIRLVLIGLPNAGKSSLFNHIVAKKRALIHEDAGTTRDYLEMEIKVGKHTVVVVDTAGIHDTNSHVEKEGVKLSYEQACDADIILWVVDGSVPHPTDLPIEFEQLIKKTPTILVLNKSDINTHDTKQIQIELTKQSISCKNNEGIEELVWNINELVTELYGIDNDQILLISQRHQQLISRCSKEIENFMLDLDNNVGFEIISKYLTSAREYIDQMIGIKTNENMLDELFGQFCIGK